MTAVRHVARALATTSTTTPRYRAGIRVGEHDLVADEPAPGGADAGPTPFGLLLSGLVSCTAITLRMYAERKGWHINSIEVDARYNIDGDGNASIDRTIALPAAVPDEQRDKLLDIAERTPVTKAIRAGTDIATTLRVTPAAE